MMRFSTSMVALCCAGLGFGCASDPKRSPEATLPMTQGAEAATKSMSLEESLEKAKREGGSVVAIGGGGKEKHLALGQVLSNDGSYEVKMTIPKSVATGELTSLDVHVTPLTGFKINQEFPTSLEVTGADGVQINEVKLGPENASTWSEKHGVFPVQVTVQKEGQHECKGVLRFAVCTETTCDPKRAEFAFVLNASTSP